MVTITVGGLTVTMTLVDTENRILFATRPREINSGVWALYKGRELMSYLIINAPATSENEGSRCGKRRVSRKELITGAADKGRPSGVFILSAALVNAHAILKPAK